MIIIKVHTLQQLRLYEYYTFGFCKALLLLHNTFNIIENFLQVSICKYVTTILMLAQSNDMAKMYCIVDIERKHSKPNDSVL